MIKAEDILTAIHTVVDKIIDLFMFPRKYMTKIILALLALSTVDVIVSGGNNKLFVSYLILIAMCVIYLIAIRDSKEKRRLFLTSVASAAALTSFSIFFFRAMTNIGNNWLEELSARLFLFSIVIVIILIITYRSEERTKEKNESKNRTGTEE